MLCRPVHNRAVHIFWVTLTTVFLAGGCRETPRVEESGGTADRSYFHESPPIPGPIYRCERAWPLEKGWYFKAPRSMPPLAASPSGGIYVLGTELNSTVRWFSRKGSLVGESDIGPLNYDIAVGPDGNIYTFHAFGEVRYFNSDGSFLGKWRVVAPRGYSEIIHNAVGIAVEPSGNIYVAVGDYDRVSYFTASGSFLGSWGGAGSAPGKFNHPIDVAVAADGTFYVADSANGRIQYFTPDGKYLGEWGSGYAPDGGFGGLLSIAVTPRGDVLTADIYKKEIEVFSGEGSFIGSFPIPGLEDREYYFRDLAVGPGGTVYVSFADPGYIWAFAPNKGE